MPQFSAVHVVVPAHDEEATLDACLAALRDCTEATPIPVSVSVVLDTCSDGTMDVIRGRAEFVEVRARNVGAARATGFRPVLDLAAGAQDLWLATTDADSRVPAQWLTTQLAHAAEGADVVAGLVEVDDWSGWSPHVQRRYHSRYRPVAGHDHVHGANLGFSARAYRRLGGFARLRAHEDVDLVARARAAGCRVACHDGDPVLTSARRSARAPEGFAHHLGALEREGHEPDPDLDGSGVGARS